MNHSITETTTHFSPTASLAAIGVKVHQLNLFGPIRAQVQIRQKTVKHTPADKLYDAFISLLAGVQGLVEINTRLRTDPGLQRAFGRAACAEQSVVQETLDACTAHEMRNEIVEELTVDQRAKTEQIEALASREMAKTEE